MRDGLDCTEASYASVIEITALTTTDLRRLATDLGAVAFGVTASAPFDGALSTLRRHRGNGMSGPLHFTYDDPGTATDITLSLPWARSLVVFAHAYLGASSPPATTGATVARFAATDQYAPLRRIAEGLIVALGEHGYRGEVLIDDNRLVDRAAAARAGVGWIGRSTMVLSPGHGPWLLIGTVATDAELTTTEPMVRTCGTCVACMPACPTGAITDEGLDAAKCIATWLQTSGPIPRWIRPLVGRRIYGCDDCLTSCPPGFPAMNSNDSATVEHPFAELLASSDDELLERFHWFYVPHREPRFLRRNILVAAGNSGESSAIGPILDHFDHPSSLVRGHAYWALARSLGIDSWQLLRDRHGDESVPDAVAELEHAMFMLREPNGS
ncbi:MAG: 4Fe-4S double cluster binding domain-containing protein [Acidimicrobiia bacterium]